MTSIDDQADPDTALDRDIDVLLQRLVLRPVSSWDHADRLPQMRHALQRLENLTADVDGRVSRRVPDAGVHALADQLAVLLDEAAGAGVPAAQVRELLGELARNLSVPFAD